MLMTIVFGFLRTICASSCSSYSFPSRLTGRVSIEPVIWNKITKWITEIWTDDPGWEPNWNDSLEVHIWSRYNWFSGLWHHIDQRFGENCYLYLQGAVYTVQTTI
jgi:hypothetical protein